MINSGHRQGSDAMRTSVRLRRLAAFVLLSSPFGLPALADPVPLPNVEYSAKATMMGGMSMLSRHSKGKMRVEMSGPMLPQAMVAYIDLMTKKMLSIMNVPGMPPMAVEADLGAEESPGVTVGEGRRVGTSKAAGEDCDLWQIDAAKKIDKKVDAVACLSRDAIPLRMEATINGKREVIFEVSELNRGPQDPKLFAPPKDVQVMQIPKGMIPQRK
jgi:hypothetical protein